MHKEKRDYARSFGAQLNYQNRRFVGWAKKSAASEPGTRRGSRPRYPAYIQFTPYGEMLPNAQSYIDLDVERKDKFGLPQPRRHLRLGRQR